jgi:hypothetical protein
MQFSPKLKKAMQEIGLILMKYDIAGLIVLHTKQHGEYFTEYRYNLKPSDSCVTTDSENNFVVKAKRDDSRLEYTANMLHMLSVNAGEMALNLIELSEHVDKATGANHTDGRYTPDNYSDN